MQVSLVNQKNSSEVLLVSDCSPHGLVGGSQASAFDPAGVVQCFSLTKFLILVQVVFLGFGLQIAYIGKRQANYKDSPGHRVAEVNPLAELPSANSEVNRSLFMQFDKVLDFLGLLAGACFFLEDFLDFFYFAQNGIFRPNFNKLAHIEVAGEEDQDSLWNDPNHV